MAGPGQNQMKEVGMTQEQLAEALGITQGGLGHWLNARREPNLEVIAKIFNILKMPGFVVNADGTISDSRADHNVSFNSINESKGSYPVISWVSAGDWMEAVEPYHRRAIDRWYDTTVECSEDSFWLDVRGDSMTSSRAEHTGRDGDTCRSPSGSNQRKIGCSET